MGKIGKDDGNSIIRRRVHPPLEWLDQARSFRGERW
jgi:hypothetical protein